MPENTELFKDIEQQIMSLAKNTAGKFKQEAIADATQILADMKADLIRWTDLLAEKKIKLNEFEWLVNSDKELVKMKGLEKAGLAASEVSAFGMSVMNAIIDTTRKKLVGNTPDVA